MLLRKRRKQKNKSLGRNSHIIPPSGVYSYRIFEIKIKERVCHVFRKVLYLDLNFVKKSSISNKQYLFNIVRSPTHNRNSGSMVHFIRFTRERNSHSVSGLHTPGASQLRLACKHTRVARFIRYKSCSWRTRSACGTIQQLKKVFQASVVHVSKSPILYD